MPSQSILNIFFLLLVLKRVSCLTRAHLTVHIEWLGLIGFDRVNATLPLASIKHPTAVYRKICNQTSY